VVEELRSTLIVIPCSAKKRRGSGGGGGQAGSPIIESLRPDTARLLMEARKENEVRARVDTRSLIPAWQRYIGGLYVAADQALAKAVREGLHLLIISGGYGVVSAAEPIGTRGQVKVERLARRAARPLPLRLCAHSLA
jgi:hypothetical protein